MVSILKNSKPILFKEAKKTLNLSSGTWEAQAFYNNFEVIFTKDGAFSNQGKRVINCNHIVNELSKFFNIYPKARIEGILRSEVKPDFVVNVEGELPLQTEQEESLRFYPLDCADYAGPQIYSKRKAFIDSEIVKKYNHIGFVLSVPFSGKDELLKHFETFHSENLIIRNNLTKYRLGRSKGIVKVNKGELEKYNETSLDKTGRVKDNTTYEAT